jgi:hypothetical protein
LLTVVLPETLLLLVMSQEYVPKVYEYAPTATDMPPPYTFAPDLPFSALYMALQLNNVLLEMM